MKQIFWGDIHNHNEIGYAEGTLERCFRLASNSLDFYAFTPHAWWVDVPRNDEAIRRHHEAGFAKVKARWNDVRRAVQEHNTPGQFVTFPAWEWHSQRWGDYCIYFPDDQSEIGYAGTLDELKELARRTGAILIPHHPAYSLGWRGLDWNALHPELSPVVEIFSEHGNSLEATSPWGMYSHSMGGMDRDQSALVQLCRGRRFGLVASGDDHFGYPGGYGQGLTAVLAEELSRPAILDAMRARHTYAVTGDRIEIDFRVNDSIPGDTVAFSDGVSLHAFVAGRDRIRSVEIIKSGRHWKRFGPETWTDDPTSDEQLLRIEWGWDLLSSTLVTTWDIQLHVKGSVMTSVVPSFCGGAGSVVEENLLTVEQQRGLRALSYTSRSNSRPVSSLSFIWKGPPTASLQLEVSGRNGDRPFSRRLLIAKQELLHHDRYISAFDLFSSPKIKLHSLIPAGQRNVEISTRDTAAAEGDFYLLKVEQENGQMAWCSPVWLAGETA